MTTVTLKMQDELNEIIVERTIDGSNLMVNNENVPNGWESHTIGNENQISKNLNRWILERGNQQHNTILTLIDWKINNN
jgi:hypothetical protein